MAIKDIQIDVSPIKRASSEFQIEHWFDSLFDRLNLTYLPQQRILKGRPDCLIGNIIIDFKYNITDRQLNQWVTSKGRQYIQEYFDTVSHILFALLPQISSSDNDILQILHNIPQTILETYDYHLIHLVFLLH